MSMPAGRTGRITRWNDDRGFGFITPVNGGEDVFVHISAFADGGRRPTVNETVTFKQRRDAEGRLQASRVSYATAGRKKAPIVRNSQLKNALFGAGGFLVLIAGLIVAGRLPPTVLVIYLAVSFLTFIVYAWDKSAARNGISRTRESTLHLLGLAGGWPGALVARYTFRHKSSKQSFITTFRGTVLINCALLGWLLTDSGQRVLAALIQ